MGSLGGEDALVVGGGLEEVLELGRSLGDLFGHLVGSK